ncbi:FeoB-associated Cys-rich membrane protein [Anaerophilus nitritogenes]|uniref:FeoB-associated Cys-rich membrane protein n=1 Tax=Anaerophilus nitritogenes TaxID=2498136 RepID=UPI00101DDC3F|nr:FeoB-associated Cys-rich membrane protein [Anaerophilus nitritogenes]
MTWIIGIPIIGLGIYCLIKSIKKEITGGGCTGCSGCSDYNCPSKTKTPKH